MSEAPNAKLPKTAEGLRALIRKRYPSNEFAVMFEVRNATGFAANRSADALAFSLWPSRGLEVSGFEIKVSRADWLKEMRAPAKAESIARYCDRWWLVAADEKIVGPSELPPTWGLMVSRASGLHVVTPAQKLDAAPLDRAFVAAVCRAAQSASPATAQISAALQVARREWETQRKRAATSIQSDGRRELESLQRAVKEFEEASGVRINSWEAGKIGSAVRLVMGGHVRVARDIEGARSQLQGALQVIEDLLTVEAIHKPIQETPA